MRRRNNTATVGAETRIFIKYLKDKEHPEVIKRDDLKTIYERQFVTFRQANGINYTEVKYRDVLRYLRYQKLIHEIGDFYIFGKNVQEHYGNLVGSEEYVKTIKKWQEIAAQTLYFCGVCGVQCLGEIDFDQHQNGARHRIHKFHYDIYKDRFVLNLQCFRTNLKSQFDPIPFSKKYLFPPICQTKNESVI